MPGRIPGISKTSLWRTWKSIRREQLRNASIRDVIDFLEYDIAPEVWIKGLLRQINSGRYEPDVPTRFTLGKSNGFSRTMTFPAIPDLVLYRTIVDHIYKRAKHREHKHVYFLRADLSKAQRIAQAQAAQQMQSLIGGYRTASQRSFQNWLRFDQYRKLLLLKKVYPHFVITDVANFFDSVLHTHISESLRGLPVPSRMIGLLFFLLERLSIRQDYSDSHGISLPVDEFDCSRTLAHIVLFDHDSAMVTLVGEGAYVRWMDDQNMGVGSRAEGLKLLGEVGRSLARLHLTANSQKSKVLTLADARRHFHLDMNRLLDKAELMAKRPMNVKNRRVLRHAVRDIWLKAKKHEGVGEFGKILKRLYRLAGFAQGRFLRRRAVADVLNDPALAERVCYYMRRSGTASEFIDFGESLINDPAQVYADVNIAVVENLLRLEPSQAETRRIRSITREILRGTKPFPGKVECQAIAPLLILRFGDRRSISVLRGYFDVKQGTVPAMVLRAAAIVYSSYGVNEFHTVRRAASKLLQNHLSLIVRLLEEICEYTDVPHRYKVRLKLGTEPAGFTKYVDVRALLTARLLKLCPRKAVHKWVSQWKQDAVADGITNYDRDLLRRLL